MKTLNNTQSKENIQAHAFAKLNAGDQEYLTNNESIINARRTVDILAARSIHKIRIHKNGILWKSLGFSFFSDYLTRRLSYAEKHGDQVADIGAFVTRLDASGPLESGWSRPINAEQVLPILELPFEQQVIAWREATKSLDVQNLTAAAIRKMVASYKKSGTNLSDKVRMDKKGRTCKSPLVILEIETCASGQIQPPLYQVGQLVA